MNKLVTALIVILVMLSAVWVLLYPLLDLQNQNDTLEKEIEALEEQVELERKRNEGVIEITKVERSGGFAWVGGIAFEVYVTVTNYGVNDVDGLTLSVGDATQGVGLLQGGNTKKVGITTGSDYSGNGKIVVTLKLGNKVLDTEVGYF